MSKLPGTIQDFIAKDRRLLAERVVSLLTEAAYEDQAAMTALFHTRVPATQELADHPTIPVACTEGLYFLSPLGLIGGLLIELTGEVLIAHFDGDMGDGLLIGFSLVPRDANGNVHPGPYTGRPQFVINEKLVSPDYREINGGVTGKDISSRLHASILEACQWVIEPEKEQIAKLQARVEELQELLQTAIGESNRARKIIAEMAKHLEPLPGEHNIDCAKRVAEQASRWVRSCHSPSWVDPKPAPAEQSPQEAPAPVAETPPPAAYIKQQRRIAELEGALSEVIDNNTTLHLRLEASEEGRRSLETQLRETGEKWSRRYGMLSAQREQIRALFELPVGMHEEYEAAKQLARAFNTLWDYLLEIAGSEFAGDQGGRVRVARVQQLVDFLKAREAMYAARDAYHR